MDLILIMLQIFCLKFRHYHLFCSNFNDFFNFTGCHSMVNILCDLVMNCGDQFRRPSVGTFKSTKLNQNHSNFHFFSNEIDTIHHIFVVFAKKILYKNLKYWFECVQGTYWGCARHDQAARNISYGGKNPKFENQNN